MIKVLKMVSLLGIGMVIVGSINSLAFAQGTNTDKSNSSIEIMSITTKEQALEVLNKYKNEFTYVYQGDETAFRALYGNGFEGYVFLPDVPTDMGYFVDKSGGTLYYFHPSGYMELITK